MKIAVLSDVHSNIQALIQVLQDIKQQQIDRVYCLGDLVGYGPRPNEVINRIRETGIPAIMGNYDQGIGYEKGDCGCAYITQQEVENGEKSIKWTTKQTTTENKIFLTKLADKINLQLNGYRVLMVHGSPRRINEYLYEDRTQKSISRILAPHPIDILICGHTHKPYHRIIDDVHVINDGSVGKPKDGDPRACYLILHLDTIVKAEFRRVKYPIEQVCTEMIKAGLPAEFAKALRTGGVSR